MAEFKAFSTKTLVSGASIEAVAAGFPEEMREVGLAILEKYGINDFDYESFYPQQDLLDAMKEIFDAFGPQMLYRIGEQIATHAVLPPGIDSLEAALQGIDVTYKMHHRGGTNIGSYAYHFIGEQHGLKRVKMVCNNPYPSAFDRGIIEGFAKRFTPKGCRDVIVVQDESQPSRAKGGDSCTYLISWC